MASTLQIISRIEAAYMLLEEEKADLVHQLAEVWYDALHRPNNGSHDCTQRRPEKISTVAPTKHSHLRLRYKYVV